MNPIAQKVQQLVSTGNWPALADYIRTFKDDSAAEKAEITVYTEGLSSIEVIEDALNHIRKAD